MCWDVGEVTGDVAKGEGNQVRQEMWGSVLVPHTLIHFPTPPPFVSPHANTLPHSPHTLSHTSPLPTHLSLSPPTPPIPLPTVPLISPYTPPHFPLTPCTLPHLFPHLTPQFQLCG